MPVAGTAAISENAVGVMTPQTRQQQSFGNRLRQIGVVALQSIRGLFVDSGMQWAAAIAYYGLLSLFPLTLGIAALASYFVEQERVVAQVVSLLNQVLPQQADQIGVDRITTLIAEAIRARGRIGLLALGTLLWTGGRVFGTITIALNIAYDVEETYGFWKRTLVELAMVATIGLIFMLALMGQVGLALLQMLLGILPFAREAIVRLVLALAPPLLLGSAFFLTYRFVPRGEQDWRGAAVGAVSAMLLVTLARSLFLYYIQIFGQYSLIYGSFAFVVILVVWAWVLAMILLFGGELAAHTQALMIEGRSSADVERRHKERSPRRTRTDDAA
jgi:membrane protein